MPKTVKIHVSGIVQGVGFRPFVYSQAVEKKLVGWVRNTSAGVEIEIQGKEESVQSFINELHQNPPPLARIDSITTATVESKPYIRFEIIESQPKPGDFIPISPDVAICPDCERELFDPQDRRFRYPFINCTNCGPRFTIIKDIPYDRPKTTMAGFAMCEKCQQEYEDPLNRRFHAQPIACPDCGPQIWLESYGNKRIERDEALIAARNLLKEGKILAVKGLGGFHLACDARNDKAVQLLRNRKRRNLKPFALMAANLATIRNLCEISFEEENLLTSHAKPIVLLKKRKGIELSEHVAPRQNTLGFMLPYTPLHHLLLETEPSFPDVLVMTSGNISEEPITYTNEEARMRLKEIADAFLMNDRPIHIRTDDSVYRIFISEYPLRRARGYAPNPIHLAETFPDILAAGSELKNTFCFLHKDYAFMSHHIGDMENLETLQSFEEGIKHFENLFKIFPQALACDLHPDYLATRYANKRAEEENLPIYHIQHHHAHLAACLADNHISSTEPAIGIIWDGTGFGTDGAIWGGEILIGSYQSFDRKYHLRYTPLPGGDSAIRKPARMALAYFWASDLDWDPRLAPVQFLCPEERLVLRMQLEQKINTPLTSSMGRLFDAVAAILGIRQDVSYEAQGAIELENIADVSEKKAYHMKIDGSEIQYQGVFESILKDLFNSVPVPTISARFHNTLCNLIEEICCTIRTEKGIDLVALSGGVWQNMLLLSKTVERLNQSGFRVLTHRQVPTNDGGLSLGQAFIAGYATKKV